MQSLQKITCRLIVLRSLSRQCKLTIQQHSKVVCLFLLTRKVLDNYAVFFDGDIRDCFDNEVALIKMNFNFNPFLSMFHW